jgi:hypothetical protein
VTGWVAGKRSERGCTRVDLEPVAWHVSAQRIRVAGYMGRRSLPPGTESEDGMRVSWRYPAERPEGGCPGGWYRSRFVASVWPFLRRRSEHGVYNANPFFDRCDDELVLALVLHLEHEQERWESWRWEQVTRGD